MYCLCSTVLMLFCILYDLKYQFLKNGAPISGDEPVGEVVSGHHAEVARGVGGRGAQLLKLLL